jgi:O-antigen/teichoic acid export membrane protein
MTDESAPEAAVVLPGQRTTGRNAMETVVFRLFALPVGLATVIVTTRYLLPSGRGAYVWAILTASLMVTLVGNVGSAYANAFREKRGEPDALLRVALLLALAVGVVAGVALVPIDVALAPNGYQITSLVAISLPALVVAQALSGALLALGRTRTWNVIQTLPPIAGLVALLVLVVGLGYGVTAALLGWCAAQVLAAGVAAVAVRGYLRPFRVPSGAWAEMRRMLSFALRIGIANLVSLLNYRVEVLVLEAQRGVRAVGIYSLSVSLAELTWLVSGALAAAVVAPVVTRSDREAAGTIARAARHALVLSIVVAAALAVVAPLLVPVVFGPAFRASITPLLILLPGVVLFAPGSIFAIWFSLRLGRTRYSIGIALFSVVVTFVAAIVLIPSHGGNGAALATTLGYGLSMVLVCVFFVRTAPVRVGDFIPGRADLEDYRSLASSFRQALRRS